MYSTVTHARTPAAWHGAVDGKGGSMTLFAVTRGGVRRVFGFYAKAAWHSSGNWISCDRAALFAIESGTTNDPIMFGVLEPGYAMYGISGYGPFVGSGRVIRMDSLEAAPDGSRYIKFGNSSNTYACTGVATCPFTGAASNTLVKDFVLDMMETFVCE